MSESFRIIGSELSPYSVKVRSWFRYKNIEHEWIPRTPACEDLFQKYARLPLVPVVITPEDKGMQDSTPTIERLEAQFPDPSVIPDDPTLAFVSALLEEYGDEWGNKWMFHYRWWRDADQISAAKRLSSAFVPEDADDETRNTAADMIRARMKDRVWFVGSSEKTKDQIEHSFTRTIEMLDTHLATRSYLLGGRPAMADFGLYAQLYECLTDPTAGAILQERTANVVPWIERMLDPDDEGDFEQWSVLAPTLEPLLVADVGRLFLPWSISNAKAIAENAEEFTVDLDGKLWTQKPQKYHARSLLVLREKYRAQADNSVLRTLLESVGCLDAML
ncbi:MAG: glutathione S-transferase [Hyphomicrobiaceae bacterium]|jgi:glutathione S-transferase